MNPDALRKGHREPEYVSPGRAGGFTRAGPSKGPDRARRTEQIRHRYSTAVGQPLPHCEVFQEQHTPGTVKLQESPGRAGGLPEVKS